MPAALYPCSRQASPVLSALTLCLSTLPQVERLETKVISPLKLYGAHIKQTRVSLMGGGGTARPGVAHLDMQDAALLPPLGRDQEAKASPEERDQATGKAGETEAEVTVGSANDCILPWAVGPRLPGHMGRRSQASSGQGLPTHLAP